MPFRRSGRQEAGKHDRLLRRRADISCPGPFLRRLLFEAHPLPLIQLFKPFGFDRATVEKPLLSTIVADETEATIPHQSLNCSVGHVKTSVGLPHVVQVLFRQENQLRKPNLFSSNSPVAGRTSSTRSATALA